MAGQSAILRSSWLIGALALVGLLYLGYTFAYPTYYYRFKLIITVDDNGTRKSAESIIEVKVKTKRFGKIYAYQTNSYTRGVAPIVDLGKHGTSVAALQPASGRAPGQLGPNLGGQDAYGNPLAFLDKHYKFVGRGPFNVEMRNYPQFVWLPRGAKSPKSARPLGTSDFCTPVGQNVSIISVKVAPTQMKVIERIEPAPRWLDAMRKQYGTAYGGKPGILYFHQSAVEADTRPDQRNLHH